MQQGVARYLDERDAIMALIEQQAGLSDSSKAKAVKYLNQFYDTLDKPKKFERQIVKRCR